MWYDARMNAPVDKSIPTIFVLFGATGDLVKKKVAPALFELYCEGKLPKTFRVLGMARTAHTDEAFRAYIQSLIVPDKHSCFTPERLEKFLSLFHYSPGDFEQASDYSTLKKSLVDIEDSIGAHANKLFFFSVLPHHYETIFKNAARVGLTKGGKGTWARLLVEKPLGHDEQSARKLNKILGTLFKEEQIYRIEHYLAKDMVQAILPFRFGNPMLNLDPRMIESVHIKLLEAITSEGRGVFYETVGALRDVGQNHLLQMLALVTMDLPTSWKATDVQAARARILKKLPLLSTKDIRAHTFRAQYEGYTTIKDVSPTSQVETYYRVQTHLRDTRWKNVPIVMESGKAFAQNEKSITITYKPGVFPSCDTHVPSTLTFEIEPEERVVLKLSTQHPGALVCGSAQEVVIPLPRPQGYVKRQYIDAYKIIFRDAIEGNRTAFVSADEVHAMWRFVDPIVAAWQKNVVPLHTYEQNTNDIGTLTDKALGL